MGHDQPQYPCDFEWLLANRGDLLLHCKDPVVLSKLGDRFHCFAHENDPFALTTHGLIWAHGVEPPGNSIVPLLTAEQIEGYPHGDFYGVCSDYPVKAKERFR